jgi:hypothetical protein
VVEEDRLGGNFEKCRNYLKRRLQEVWFRLNEGAEIVEKREDVFTKDFLAGNVRR